MANIIDYVKYYGSKTFDEVPFNDVDALIFAELSYAEFDSFLSKGTMPLAMYDFGKTYFSQVKPEDMKGRIRIYREAYDLFSKVYDTIRYRNVIISNYQNVVDDEKQFCAMTFRYPKKWVYVAFEGTDCSIIGWKEDFALSHMFPVPSQKLAVHYLEEEVSFLDKNVYIGGHSKGGNLALVASMYVSSFVKHRLKRVYNFDGPGLREKEYHSLPYAKIKNKIKMFVPSESVVGMILCHDLHYTVVKSSAKGVWQHDGFSWECFGSMFVPGDLSKKSMTFSKDMQGFLKEIPDKEREEFVESIFTVLNKSGITTTENVTISKIVKCIANISEVTSNKVTREKLGKIFNIFLKYFRS
jgi:hypothetical protein